MSGSPRESLALLVLPGDGIGPEITRAAVRVVDALGDALGVGVNSTEIEVGLARLAAQGGTLPPDLAEQVEAHDGIVLGPLATSDYPPPERGGVNVSAWLRRHLHLDANIRPSRGRAALGCLAPSMDLVIVRENSEGFLSDRVMAKGSGEFMPTEDVAIAMRKITAAASRRIAEVAVGVARARRGRVTAVHKANALPMSDGLFLREVRGVLHGAPEIEYDELLVDAMAALLVRCPERFDVVVTTNLFGDILSDEAAELAGSLGLAGSLNAGDRHAMAQAVHGSASDIAGCDVANPGGLMLSIGQLLGWLARRRGSPLLHRAAARLEAAVDAALGDARTRTRDVGGSAGTQAFADAVIRHFAAAHDIGEPTRTGAVGIGF
jgi:3-isopropylmalate dehydrogenase